MNKRMILGFLGLVFIAGLGLAQDTAPVAVSPGAESGPAVVRQSSPTFSWTAVPWALTYKVVVFEAVDGEPSAYEQIAANAAPVLVMEIPGQAYSWTPSAGEALINGGRYVWYVGAMINPAQGSWSKGRTFVVEEYPISGFVSAPRAGRTKEDVGAQDPRPEDRALSETAEAVFDPQDDPLEHERLGLEGTEGESNTFYGTNAGNATMTGTQNSFFGNYAGYKNTTGSYNSFLGRTAGLNNTTGSYNTFAGRTAGYNNTTASQNAFFGYSAGYNNTTASNNTFFGFSAGFSTTTGSRNTFIGTNAGRDNSSGFDNTFLGIAAGTNNETGKQNTFVGAASGSSNTTGTYNTCIGYFAGFLNTTGVENVYIGDEAGYSSNGNGNVFIGNQAGKSVTASNKLYLDNWDTATPLIYGDFSTNRVGINNAAPGAMFVVGTGGAVCDGTTWTDGSSRDVKENIEELTGAEALGAFEEIKPVKFNYKQNKEEARLGFIAEDVPELVAMNNRKGLSPMDVVAMLTKVVQEQQKAIAALEDKVARLEKKRR